MTDSFGRNWSARLQAWMDNKGWTAKELSKRADVDYESLVKYINGKVANPRGSTLGKIANVFEKTEQQLRFGLDNGDHMPSIGNTTREIALVSLYDLYQLQPGQKLKSVWSGVMTTIADKDAPDACIAVDIDDDSMSPEFNLGDIVIINPKSDITPGCFVVAIVDGQNKAVFRKYKLSSICKNGDKDIELLPINEFYPTLYINKDNAGRIIGRVDRVVKKV